MTLSTNQIRPDIVNRLLGLELTLSDAHKHAKVKVNAEREYRLDELGMSDGVSVNALQEDAESELMTGGRSERGRAVLGEARVRAVAAQHTRIRGRH